MAATIVTVSWRNVLRYVKESFFDDRLVIVAPGVAFFLMLGLMPGLAALILIYGIVADPLQVREHFETISPAIPPEAATLISTQIQHIAQEPNVAGWGVLVSIALTLWAGSYAMGVIMAALNVTFGTRETRGYIRLTVLRVVLTLAAIGIALSAVGVLVVVPTLLAVLPISESVKSVVSLVRWPLLLLVGIVGLAMLYRYAPDRERPHFHSVTWGSSLAAILWVLGSSLFSLYVGRFNVYHEVFGAMGTVVILMLWLLISAFAILLGAEVDAAIEREKRANAPKDE